MNFQKTSSCAIQDIDKLSDHPTGLDAMIAFCQQAILKPPVFGRYTGRVGEISSFYVFSAAVGPGYPTYGKMFYDFIKSNNLGEVYESPTRPNKAWHPDHENQVYIFMPDQTALRAWWEKNDPSTVATVAVTTEPKKKRVRKPVPLKPGDYFETVKCDAPNFEVIEVDV